MRILNDLLNEGEQHFNLWDRAILIGYRGSIAHGTYKPNHIDDKDVIVVIIPPIEYYFGLRQFGGRGTKELKRGCWDVVVYEFRKFVSLLVQNNPNVMSMLWLEDDMYLKKTLAGQTLLDNRDLFSSKRAYKSYGGYASSQIKKMHHCTYEGYMGEKRKRLVEKFGFDLKNASHCIRLQRQGIEFLETGKMTVRRPDAGELMQIKNGEWSLEKIEREADHLFKKLDHAMDRCKLPDEPDIDRINKLMVEILEDKFNERK